MALGRYDLSSLSSGSGGGNVYGSRIGAIPNPDPYGNLGGVYPNLGPTNAAVSGDILSKLTGQLSPGTIEAIQNAAAQFGVTSGMPGSGGYRGTLTNDLNLRDIGRTAEDQVTSGLQAYNATIPTISGTQTLNPNLQTEIAATNATNRAAPDPAAAGSHAEQLFQQYLGKLSNPAGGTFTGTSGSGKPWWSGGGSSDWVSNLGSYDWTTNPRYK